MWLTDLPQVMLIDGHQAGNHADVSDYFAHLMKDEALNTATILRYIQPTIEEVRSMQHDIRTATNDGRIIVIQDIHGMKLESLNALLKTLEEPQSKNFFVLSALHTDMIPDTVLSRTAHLALSAPPKNEFIRAYARAHEEKKILAAYAASGGAIPTFEAYLAGETAAIDTAKLILSEKPYERLQRVVVYSKDRVHAQDLLDALLRTLQYLIRHDTAQSQKWIRSAELCAESQARLTANASVKLTLTRLFAHL